MNDPERLIDDDLASDELRNLLRGVRRAEGMDEATRTRGRRNMAAMIAVPATLAAGIGVSTAAAAAIGGAAGIVTVGVMVFSGPLIEKMAAPPAVPTASIARAAPRAPARPPAVAEPVVAPEPAPPAPLSDEPRPKRAAPQAAPTAEPATDNGLAQETKLLEQARRALVRAPAESLEIVREHERRFDKPSLGAERRLIELEALVRLGRRAEARALAQAWLERGADGLYGERVRQLMEKIDRTP